MGLQHWYAQETDPGDRLYSNPATKLVAGQYFFLDCVSITISNQFLNQKTRTSTLFTEQMLPWIVHGPAAFLNGAPGKIRTYNPLSLNQVPLPIGLLGHY